MSVPNQLFYGDNLDNLRHHIADESVDRIYLDPPFNSNRNDNVLFKESGESSPTHVQVSGNTWTWGLRRSQVSNESRRAENRSRHVPSGVASGTCHR